MASATGQPRELLIRSHQPEADQVLVAVQDSGIGIDPANVDRLFQAFFTTKPKGMGMGLSISRSIIGAHGGRLWASHNVGPGATFQFTLPLLSASVGGLIGFPTVPVYVASKHAVIGLTKAVALEFAKQHVRVNAVVPGAVDTRTFRDFTAAPEVKQVRESAHPMGRIGQPEEIASAVVWLCSNGASFVTGQTFTIDGGYTAQ
jgi:hypothetical protein